MQYSLIDVGQTTEVAKSVQLATLALHIAADCLPDHPQPQALGFGTILECILESKTIRNSQYWTAREAAAAYEKQWKPIFSWMVGIAFCREVLLGKGYIWWAPVSAFFRSPPPNGPLLQHWISVQHAMRSSIRPLRQGVMMPDYVVAKSAGAGYELSFVECKGTAMSIAKRRSPPVEWSGQARNAEFRHQGQVVTPAHNFVVATRFAPNKIRATTRKVVVRAWNNSAQDHPMSTSVFRGILVSHYFFTMARIGLRGESVSLAAAFIAQGASVSGGPARKGADSFDTERFHPRTLPGSEGLEVHEGSEASHPGFEGGRSRIGLLPCAKDLIRALADPPDGSLDKLLSDLKEEVAKYRQAMNSDPAVYVRDDGLLITAPSSA